MSGFVDVHIHGAVGVDVNSADVDGLLEIAGFLARSGVTAWVPTLVPDSDENYRRAVGAIDQLMRIQDKRPVAQAVGVHYEGVFANEKMCGALRPEFFKKFTSRVFSEIPRLKNGVHMMTFSPEIEGGIELVRALVSDGWIASIGHTNANEETLDAAFTAGARHLTHFCNAMTGMHHRDVGVVGWGLTNAEVTFDIIADGVHVSPKILEFVCQSKSVENVILISDSIAPTGLGDGNFQVWGEAISVLNGKTRNARGSIAGSVITMLDAAKMMLTLGFSVKEVEKMSSDNPARLLGIDPNSSVGLRSDGSIEFVKIHGMDVDLS